MREILFRGKRVDNGEWIEGYFVKFEWREIPEIYTGWNCYTLTPECHGIEPSTVGQYTGLTDKNGKKIFEGDILKIYPDCDYCEDYSISTVYSYNGVLCVDYRGDDFDSTALGFINDVNDDADFEIIGNIYDNPELVGGESDG